MIYSTNVTVSCMVSFISMLFEFQWTYFNHIAYFGSHERSLESEPVRLHIVQSVSRWTCLHDEIRRAYLDGSICERIIRVPFEQSFHVFTPNRGIGCDIISSVFDGGISQRNSSHIVPAARYVIPFDFFSLDKILSRSSRIVESRLR